MQIYINVIDPSFMSAKYWRDINLIFKQQSPTWKPGKKLFDIERYSKDENFMFILYIALIYKAYIIEVVKSRRWEKFWIPLNKKYLADKIRKGFYPNTWMRTGRLIESISIHYDKARKRVRVGIDGRLKYTHRTKSGKTYSVPILLVAKWMEYGTVKMPARPLFRRARDFISKNIKRYYIDFISMIDTLV